MTTTTDVKSPVTRVNALLKKAGHEIQLVRGRGYYYLRDTGEKAVAAGFRSGSIYVYRLERTEKDFEFARHMVNDILRRENLATI